MRLLSWITAANVLVAAGFSLAGLIAPQAILPPGAVVTDAAHIFAMYAAARTLALALLALLAIYRQWPRALMTLGTLAGVIQFVDGFIGLYQHDAGKSVGPLIIALLQFYALWRCHKRQD